MVEERGGLDLFDPALRGDQGRRNRSGRRVALAAPLVFAGRVQGLLEGAGLETKIVLGDDGEPAAEDAPTFVFIALRSGSV